ncbi:HXXEE domain-containing protein [Denitrobaculum tricleocarpae]|nr:HXXEE domain-containing protein [Denitrobaculum tricleocarpae]
MKKTAGIACLSVSFAMLWVPLGQQVFLIEHWMKVGTFMAPFLLFIALTFRQEARLRPTVDVRAVALLLLIAYIAHQFEEHWVDIYGNNYSFKPYLNATVLESLGAAENARPVLSDAGVFVINTSLVWLVAALAIWRGPDQVFPTLCMAAIVVVNALTHLGAWSVRGDYNPGLLTASILFLPIGLTTYLWIFRSGVARWQAIAASLGWGGLAHVIMIGGMILSGWLQTISEITYFALLVGWSILPVFLFRAEK